MFFWATGTYFAGLVLGVTPLGFLAVRCTDGRLRFVPPAHLTTATEA